jgi:ABC-type multidrug transport system fused ATPase/permease subunit
VRRADAVAVVRDGVVVELGAHAALAARPGGEFARMLAQDAAGAGEWAAPALAS